MALIFTRGDSSHSPVHRVYLVGRRRLSMQEKNPEPQVRLRMNERGKVQRGQSEVFVAVGAQVVLQPRFLEESGSESEN
ncbi:unnamed protein product [Cuscuta campestris]|uniref:Uncharacterized protein n=1 Tax=Cuscuta campestris TaxID=132261 RepID=A0A484LHJ6_9ASTE|nr:unnamed protein product [Cuscuta campestris]